MHTLNPTTDLRYALEVLDEYKHLGLDAKYANKLRAIFCSQIGDVETISQFMRSATDHRTQTSICKKCLATVADSTSQKDLETKERVHICKRTT